jgi:hypothetical protein
VVDAQAVGASLSAAAQAFGAAAAPVELRWGPLFEELDAQGDTEYASAVELIYEGYLLHYRESRACLAGSAREHSLLAGDFFYARGLRLIAARGDAAAVGLLARLMASCSYLRSVGAPFADDDALWATAMGGLAALRAGASAGTVEYVFDELDAALVRGDAVDVLATARAGAPRLGLRHPARLDAALDAADSAAGPATAAGQTDEAAGHTDAAPAAAGAAVPRSGPRRQTWT